MTDPKRDEWEVFLEEQAERERRLLDEEYNRVPYFLTVEETEDDDSAIDMARDLMNDALRRATGLDG